VATVVDRGDLGAARALTYLRRRRRSVVSWDRFVNPEPALYRYNRHSAGSLGWPIPKLKYQYIFQTKCTEAILSNSTRATGTKLYYSVTEERSSEVAGE